MKRIYLLICSWIVLGIKILFVFSGKIEEAHQIEIEIQKQELAKEIDESPLFRSDKEYLNIDQYKMEEPFGYKIGIIVDPCKGKSYGCCQDKFGSPTYEIDGTDLKSSVGSSDIVDEQGNKLLIEVSRLADRFSKFDDQCYNDEKGIAFRLIENQRYYNDPFCVGRLQALVANNEIEFPDCWDHNTSVNAIADCYAPDGLKRSYCVSIGYTQTAYITQCGKQYTLHNHCGTFLELHKPNDEEIISQTRLLGEYTSGFRTTTLPLYFKGDKSKTICKGNYEIWWVQRTRHNFIIQYKKKFFVQDPPCDFDNILNNQYKVYHTIGNVFE